MLRREEGGTSPSPALRARGSPGFVCPRSGARAAGIGRRGADKGRAPRGKRRAKSSAPLGGERDPGLGVRSRELPRPLEQWGAGAAPGLGWRLGWNPRNGRGRQQRGCRAQHCLCCPRKPCLGPVRSALPFPFQGWGN